MATSSPSVFSLLCIFRSSYNTTHWPLLFPGNRLLHPVPHTPCLPSSWSVPGGSVQVASASPIISPLPLTFLLLHFYISFSSLWSDHQSLPCNLCSRVPGRPVAISSLLHLPLHQLASLPGSNSPGSFTSIHFTLSSRARSTCTFTSSLHCPTLPSASFPFLLFLFPFSKLPHYLQSLLLTPHPFLFHNAAPSPSLPQSKKKKKIVLPSFPLLALKSGLLHEHSALLALSWPSVR